MLADVGGVSESLCDQLKVTGMAVPPPFVCLQPKVLS